MRRSNHLLSAAAIVLITLAAGCDSDQNSSSDSMTANGPAYGTDGQIGFIAVETEDTYTVAIDGTEAATALIENGELASPITAAGARIKGKKVYAADEDTLALFLGWDDEGSEAVTTAAFVTTETEDAFYVAMAGTEAAEELEANGELGQPITAVGARVKGKKVYADTEDTLAAFLGW